VKKSEERKRAFRTYKTGSKLPDGRDEFAAEYEVLGWGIHLENSGEWLIFDADPGFSVGDRVEVTIRRVE
jgi:hypothetical protein